MLGGKLRDRILSRKQDGSLLKKEGEGGGIKGTEPRGKKLQRGGNF